MDRQTSDAAKMAPHKYKQLEDNEIRVLKVPPTIHASWQLIHVKLDSKPQYTALSKFPNHIMIDGHRFPITANLHNALVEVTPRIVAPKGLFASRDFLWIDAICIYSRRTTMKHPGNLRLGTSTYCLRV
jgi:hypothetical protein